MRPSRVYTFTFGYGDERKQAVGVGNTRTSAERGARRRLRELLSAEKTKGMTSPGDDPANWSTLACRYTPSARAE